MTQLLQFLSGKKGTIATILMGIVSYLATKDILGEPEVVLATLIIGALFGTASHYTAKLIYNR